MAFRSAPASAEYPPIKEVIDALPKLFNSWSTRPEFLPWLASWVALELEPTWTEYQKRKLITEIVSIYRLRGLEAGLHAYLDIYVQTPARPRIAIDDGSALLRARFKDDGTATLSTIAYSQVVSLCAGGHGLRHDPNHAHPAVRDRGGQHQPLLRGRSGRRRRRQRQRGVALSRAMARLEHR